MPRDGSSIYHIPPGTQGVPDTTIESAKYNAYIADVEQDLNLPRPIIAGGTGASSADGSLDSLSAEKFKMVITNWDAIPYRAGSFYSATTAIGNAPVAGHAFAGFVYFADASNLVVEARDLTDPGHVVYSRVMTASAWSPWKVDSGAVDLSAAANIAINGSCAIQQIYPTNSTYPLVSGVGLQVADMLIPSYVHGAGTASLVAYQADSIASPGPSPPPGFSHAAFMYAVVGMPVQANGDFAALQTFVEGTRMVKLQWGTANAQPLTYAFMFYTNVPGTAFVKFSNHDASRNYYAEFTAPLGGWNFITGNIPGDVAGVWRRDTTRALNMTLFASGKSASLAAPGSWSATNAFQTTNSGNMVNANGETVGITGLLLLPGLSVIPSALALSTYMRSVPDELLLCRRYYEKSYNIGVQPGASGAAGSESRVVASNSISGADYGGVSFAVDKRAPPTVTIYGFGGGSGQVSNPSGVDLGAASGTAAGIGENRFIARSGGAVATTTNNAVLFHWTADARP